MRIAIVDDEDVFRTHIEDRISAVYGRLDTSCFLYADGAELIKSLDNGMQYDAVFLDIEMKEKDGMSTAKVIRSKGIETPIIFVTSHVEMAMEGYEVAAFRFLGKPIDDDKLKAVLLDLEKNITTDSKLTVHKDGEDILVSLKDIYYVESANNNVKFALNTGVLEVRAKFNDILGELSRMSQNFFRIHRCYAVNLEAVSKFGSKDVNLLNGEVLPIARGAAADFKKAMFEYVKRSGR